MIFLLFIAGIVGWAYLYNRLRNAEDRLNEEQYERSRNSEIIAELTRRVWALEKSPQAPPIESPAPQPAPFTPPPAVVFDPPSVVVPPLEPSPVKAPEPTPAPLPVIPIPEYFREPALVPPSRTWRDQLRESMGGQEWEAVVGGSWLNKLGVLVLVIGIALLLGYEFTRVGPLGRVATGIAVSLVMLIGGLFIVRKRGYAIFARGLIG